MRSRARDYRTLDNLNADRETIAWYWKVLAFVASCIILGGFLILPATFDTDARLRVSKTALGVFSVALLTTGFSLTGLVCFACRNYIFRADCVFMPSLYSSILGLLTVLYSFIISDRYEWNVAALLATIGASLSIVVYSILLIITYRKISAMSRSCDQTNLIPQPRPSSPGRSSVGYHEPIYFANHHANMYPTARPPPQETQAQPEILTEDDLVQQQMLMLLNNKGPQPSINTDSAANSFHRIDFTPVDEPEQEPQPVSIPSSQPSFSLNPNPYHGFYAPVAQSQNPEFASSSNVSMQPWDGVWRVARPVEPDPARREERRREIEQGR